MSNREKLGKPKGIRLAPKLEARLAAHAHERGEDEIDIIRRGLASELDRLDSMIPDATRVKLNKLREAGLDFDQVVIEALSRKAVEDAQLKIPAVIPVLSGVGG